MKQKLPIRVSLTLMLALVLGACGPGLPQTVEQSTSEPLAVAPSATETAEPPTEAAGLCANMLYPVKQGATWTYQSTGGLSGDFSFTDTITDVREDGFTVTSHLNDLNLKQEWACKPEGLASQTFGSGVAGGISTSGVNMDLTTSNVQGVTVPKTVNAGDEWPYSLDFTGGMELEGASVDTKGTANFNFNALDEESVTVPAGTFNAVKLHVDLTLNMQFTYSNFTAPLVITIPSDIWYAPDVGWVKASSSGNIFGNGFNESIELQSYDIP